ncbi:uncharacterized protein PGTG_03320 [Puccinia graminis f. sp. tritici CRL 75-36-700-3]|uniref:glutathione gamma-glutamylcysteinyltransferase n=1 Tax=Puccinia graminis f. sp. tritici (strain CRL 75-36-700-3 / race SCCL) TaxID=418459 RepID=E3JZ89_PUCGT|nr:uncharacterized protein PGTG_03320 [Puccinia graminis f. sp. tritici CRL 75-36-700-3]EFP77364.1 hypothetical protein PGTG_03320 [Puccinia graminis f. sp. tritici CRL 75-36-700-3]
MDQKFNPAPPRDQTLAGSWQLQSEGEDSIGSSQGDLSLSSHGESQEFKSFRRWPEPEDLKEQEELWLGKAIIRTPQAEFSFLDRIVKSIVEQKQLANNVRQEHQELSSPKQAPEAQKRPDNDQYANHIQPFHSSTISQNQLNTEETFYQRQLPKSCVSFTSDQGKGVFRSALAEGHLESFFPLASQLVTQHEPAFCSLATLCTVLNALEVDPKQVWKHPWRWFDQEMLDSDQSLESIRKNGITLAEFNSMARRNGLALTSRSPPTGNQEDVMYQSGLQEFRSHVAKVTSQSSAFLIVSFCRESLGQTGTGHFSPVAGYSPEHDQVLVLEVARFKYPSYWVGLEDLYKSMIPIDPVSQRPRGYTILSHSPSVEKTNGLAKLME